MSNRMLKKLEGFGIIYLGLKNLVIGAMVLFLFQPPGFGKMNIITGQTHWKVGTQSQGSKELGNSMIAGCI